MPKKLQVLTIASFTSVVSQPSFEGEALEAELRALREEYFAHEAKTIEAEERSGFFRFERPRIYGRN